MITSKPEGVLPTVPQAFFDEFGVNADDRVMDYGQACYDAGALSAAPQQHGQEVEDALPWGWKLLTCSTAHRADAVANIRQMAEDVGAYDEPAGIIPALTQAQLLASIADALEADSLFERNESPSAQQLAEAVAVDAVPPRPMETAPRDGTIVRLLVNFTDNATEDVDADTPIWTIGGNTFEGTGEDVWQFAGWNWQQDCFTQGEGTPIGWLPLVGNDTKPPAIDIGKLRGAVETLNHAIATQLGARVTIHATRARQIRDELAALIGDGGEAT